MKKIETYWTYEVASIEGERPRSLVIAPCDNQALALAGAFKDATYYIGVCGYKVAVAFHELCAACQGTGLIHRRTKRTCRTSHCKTCKGHPIISEVPMTQWVQGENVTITGE